MAFELFRSKQIANIIIKDHVIRYIGVKQSSPLVVQKYQERYLPPGLIEEGKIIDRDTLRLILEECVHDWGIKKKQVRFIIPDSFVSIRKANIPIDIRDDEIVGFLYSELDSTIHLPFDEPVLDIRKLSETAEKKEILIFAAPEEISLDYSTLLEDVSLRPIAADISPLCMYRLFENSNKTSEENHSLLIQFDLQTVNLCIFHQHVPIFMRHLNIDSAMDDWDIQNQPSGPTEIKWVSKNKNIEAVLDEIYKEIEHVLNFYHFSILQGKEQVTDFLLCGDHPFFEEVYDTMSNRFDVPVALIDNIEKLSSNYYLPLGLALKEVQ